MDTKYKIYLALIIIILIIIITTIVVFTGFFKKSEKYQIAKNPLNEYVRQNMSIAEFRKINKYDYPGELID